MRVPIRRIEEVEITQKKILAAFLVFLVLAFVAGYSLNVQFVHKNPSVSYNVYVLKDGVQIAESGNLITNIGENFIGNCTLGLENNGTWAISLSNVGSPAAAWTELDTEVAANGFTRAAGAVVIWVNSGDYAFNVTKTFTASGTQQLQTAGLNWDSTAESNNNLLAAATFTQTTFNSGDTLTITWVITIDAN